ncbi:MAG TPA: ThuA domain-containing protein [Verrucomicrobiae bacterium]
MTTRLVLLALLSVGSNLLGAEGIPASQARQILEAGPAKPQVMPQKPRRVLIWNTPAHLMEKDPHKGYCIPYGSAALEALGKKSGAFEPVVSDDLSVYLPESLKRFDAIVMNNSSGPWITPTEADLAKPEFSRYGADKTGVEQVLRNSLLNFVTNGGGLVMLHYAVAANSHWPEFKELCGATFSGHPWNEEIGVTVEEPGSPLLAAFGGRDFRIADEIYEYGKPYDRDRLRVLLSLDPARSNMGVKWINRKDNDFALAWVKSYAKGRVFVTTFGHRTELFWDPRVLRFYLDAVQFATGDLSAPTAPRPDRPDHSRRSGADWPMLHGGPEHSGLTWAGIRPPFSLAWAREIDGERLGTATEPIVYNGTLFVATHAGNLYALKAESGDALWRFQAHGAFLHSPAVGVATLQTGRTSPDGIVVAGNADGSLYGVSAATGKLVWQVPAGHGGFSASPVIDNQTVYIGSRLGEFYAVSLDDGKVLWQQTLGVPIRQTAAVADAKVLVTGEDLRVHCFSAIDGQPVWTSEQLPGQTARDYYPIIIQRNGRNFVIVRTNPILNMGQRIGRDRTMLCRNAEIDDSSWQKLEAWIKSDQARGNPELWAKEQKAILEHLAREPDAQTFFVLDATTGKQPFVTPVLWIAGCQGVGAEPALTPDGRLLVFYRSAYGNWNHGVAPLVALGLLDLDGNKITPLFHQQGAQPQWNCFWGTADESQNFVVAGDTVLIVHQGTLSGFDLKKNQLFPIWGERDTYGGFKNPPWARNEWHGPARSGVAVVGSRIYWQTGSRILCITAGEPAERTADIKPARLAKDVPSSAAPKPPEQTTPEMLRELRQVTESILAERWAPLFTDPGLAGRVFAFQTSGEVFEALAWAYPHLGPDLQAKAKAFLRAEWVEHPPYSARGSYPLNQGARREWFRVRDEYCARLGGDKQPHPFGNLSAVELYAARCAEESLVVKDWPKLKASYDDFSKSGWRLDGAKGDVYANRYLASLLAYKRLAEKAADIAAAREIAPRIEETTQALVAWWTRAAERGTLKTFNQSSELDPFIGKGDGISLAVAPHRHKLALFQDLTPELASLIRARAPQAAQRVWETFAALCPTWHLSGEERQVHFGENFIDPPDFALSGFRALACLEQASPETLAAHVDLPFCQADLYYLIKLAITVEAKP